MRRSRAVSITNQYNAMLLGSLHDLRLCFVSPGGSPEAEESHQGVCLVSRENIEGPNGRPKAEKKATLEFVWSPEKA